MAEYIDREELECDTEWSDYFDNYVSYSKLQIENAPTADVVERSKIDKAIEEMEKAEKEANENNCFKSFTMASIYRDCIEILKRNIGE